MECEVNLGGGVVLVYYIVMGLFTMKFIRA